MHWIIYGFMAISALADCNNCEPPDASDAGVTFWSDQYFIGLYWAKFMRSEDAGDSAALQQMRTDCNATYIMCPAFRMDDMETLALDYNDPSSAAAFKNASAIPPESYHTDILYGFSNIVAGPTVETLKEAGYSRAQAIYLQQYGLNATKDNWKYFTFKCHEVDQPIEARYGGNDFSLDFEKLVKIQDDSYMLSWARFYATVSAGKNPVIDTLVIDTPEFNNFLQRTYVSTSLDLCWSLLLSGLKADQLNPKDPFDVRPGIVDTPATGVPAIWQNICGKTCGNTQKALNAKSCCPKNNPKNNMPCTAEHCRAMCIADPTCKGFYFKTNPDPIPNNGYAVTSFELADMDLNTGSFDAFWQLSRYNTPEGLSFNRQGTQPCIETKLPKYSYKLIGTNMTSVTPHPIHTLTACQLNLSYSCIVTAEQGTYPAELVPLNASRVRQYVRVADDTPGRCLATCMMNLLCLAWTWDATGCTITTNIGQRTSSSMAPSYTALEQLGLANDHYCSELDHAYDYCTGKCVNIHNALEMGWCNHNWVTCHEGRYVTAKTPNGLDNTITDNTRTCVGGMMPTIPSPPNKDKDSYRFIPVMGNGPRTEYTAENYAYLWNRSSVTINNISGAYLTTHTTCANVGASPRPQNPTAWEKWTQENLHDSQSTYMNITMALKDNRTYNQTAFVTATTGYTKGDNKYQTTGGGYTSTTSGIAGNTANTGSIYAKGDCGENVCVFPTCMYNGLGFYRAYSPFTKKGCLTKSSTYVTEAADTIKEQTGFTTDLYLRDAVYYYTTPIENAAGPAYNYGRENSRCNAARKTCLLLQDNNALTINSSACVAETADVHKMPFLDLLVGGHAIMTQATMDGLLPNQQLIGNGYPAQVVNAQLNANSQLDQLSAGTFTGLPRPHYYAPRLSTVEATDPGLAAEYQSTKVRNNEDYRALYDESALPYIWHNAANAGFMCPIGLLALPPQASIPDSFNANKTAHVWHPYAQLTARCPSNMPIRCSHLQVIVPAGGTCEYGPNWNTNSSSKFFSGMGSFGEAMIDEWSRNITNLKDNPVDAAAFISKMESNSPCNVYDHGCYTVEQAAKYQVCGAITDNSQSNLGGVMCGSNPDTLSGGFCGIDFEANEAIPFTPLKAYTQCQKWPNANNPVCPAGYALSWSDTAPTCVLPVKATKPQSTYVQDFSAQPSTVSNNAGVYEYPYRVSAKCKSSQAWDDGSASCISKTCSERTDETCEADDLKAYRGEESDPTATQSCVLHAEEGACKPKHCYNHVTDGTEDYVNQAGNCTIDICRSKTRKLPSKCNYKDDGIQLQEISMNGGLQTNANADLHWPGFTTVTGKQSQAGVGPAYGAKFEPCESSPSNCYGFDMCNVNNYAMNSSCLNTLLPTCCSGIAGGTYPTANGCTVNSTAMCGGGKYLFWEDRTAAQSAIVSYMNNECGTSYIATNMCHCCTTKCNGNNAHAVSRSSYTISSGTAAGYTTNLTELYSVFVDTNTGIPTATKSCTGPAGRLLGDVWQGGTGNCACATRSTYQLVCPVASAPLVMIPSTPNTGGSPLACDQSDLCVGYREIGGGLLASAKPAQPLNTTLWDSVSTSDCYYSKLSALRPRMCDPTVSCAYTQTRTELDAFMQVGVNVTIDGPIYDCADYKSIRDAESACISGGTQCIGIAKAQSSQWCMVTVENTVNLNPPEYSTNTYKLYLNRTTTTTRPRWKNSQTKLYDTRFYRVGPSKYPLLPGMDTSSILSFCAADHLCVGATWSVDHMYTLVAAPVNQTEEYGYYQVRTNDTCVSIAGSVCHNRSDFALKICNSGTICQTGQLNNLVDTYIYYDCSRTLAFCPNVTVPFSAIQNWRLKLPTNKTCNVSIPYAYDLDGKTGGGCCSIVPVSTGAFGPDFLDRCPGNSTDCGFNICQSSLPTCAPHRQCVNGISTFNEIDKTCMCTCNPFFAGDNCTTCTRGGADPVTCETCKDHYIDIDGLCMCRRGFDIRYDCKKCLPNISGADCQTNTCSYEIADAANARGSTTHPAPSDLKNIVVAAGDNRMLYDGVYSAGDGNVPFSMRNSFVQQDQRLYWIDGLQPPHTRVEVLNTPMCAHWNNAVWNNDTCAVPGSYWKNCNGLYRCTEGGSYLMVMSRPATGPNAPTKWTNFGNATQSAVGTVLHTCSLAGYSIKPKGSYKCYGNTITPGDFTILLPNEPNLDKITHYTEGEWLYSLAQRKVVGVSAASNHSGAPFSNCTHIDVQCAIGYAQCLLYVARVVARDYPGNTTFATYSTSNTTTLTACFGISAIGPLVYRILEATDSPPIHPIDIVTDQDTWGAVCPAQARRNDNRNTDTLQPLDVSNTTTPGQCALKCKSWIPLCGSFYWGISQGVSHVCQIYSVSHVTSGTFPSSEYFIDPPRCVSGGYANTGRWRNLPNKPELAIPSKDEMLVPVDPSLVDTLVCQWSDRTAPTATPYLLSRYRRHPWLGGENCTNPRVQYVDSVWLYSLPRGPTMDKATVRHGAGGRTAQVAALSVNTTAHCAELCRSDPGCDIWFHDGEQCATEPSIPLAATNSTFNVVYWGGTKLAVPQLAWASATTCDGMFDGYKPAGATGICVGGTLQPAAVLQSDRTTVLYKSQASYLSPPYSIVLPSPDNAVSTSSQHTAQACCNYCMSSVYAYTGSDCRCYDMPTAGVNTQLEASWRATGCTGAIPHDTLVYYETSNETTTVLGDMHSWCVDAQGGDHHEIGCCGSSGCGASLTCTQLQSYTPAPVDTCWMPVAFNASVGCNPQVTMQAYAGTVPDPNRMVATQNVTVRSMEECTNGCIAVSSCMMVLYHSRFCTTYELPPGKPKNGDDVPLATVCPASYPYAYDGNNQTGSFCCSAQPASKTVCQGSGVSAVECPRAPCSNYTANGVPLTFVKRGGCTLNKNGDCQYDRTRPTAPGVALSSSCSANGALYSFAADARLFYGVNNAPDTISTYKPSCATTQPTYRPLPMLAGQQTKKPVALKTVDLQLLWNRFSNECRSNSTEVSTCMGGNLSTGGLSQISAQTPSAPNSTKQATAQRNSAQMQVSGNSDITAFALTESYALPPDGNSSTALSICSLQGDLAMQAVGELTTTFRQVCYASGNCLNVSYGNTDMQTQLENAYILQSQLCLNALGFQLDTSKPIPLVMYVQAPAVARTNKWQAYTYQGLPTYQLTSMDGQKSLTVFGSTDPRSDYVIPFPTPAPTFPQPPTPAPTLCVTASATCGTSHSTDTGCSFTGHPNHTVNPRLTSDTLIKLNLTSYNVSEGIKDCINLCGTLLLCRFITHSPCVAYGFTVAAEQGKDNKVSPYVSQVNDGCAIQKGFYEVVQDAVPVLVPKVGTNTTLVVKNDCCIAVMPY